MPSGIIFDLDGTLVDSGADIAAACNHALRAVGRPEREPGDIARMVGDGARTLLARAAGLAEDHPDLDPLLGAFLAYYEAHPADHTRFLPGALEALDSLRNYPIALCTNKPRKVTVRLLESLGALERFRAVVAGGDLPDKKPSPGPVLACARALGLEPSALVMVGDGVQDVVAGKRAGCLTVGVLGGFGLREALEAAGPDALLSSLHELAGWLSGR